MKETSLARSIGGVSSPGPFKEGNETLCGESEDDDRKAFKLKIVLTKEKEVTAEMIPTVSSFCWLLLDVSCELTSLGHAVSTNGSVLFTGALQSAVTVSPRFDKERERLGDRDKNRTRTSTTNTG